MARLSLDWRGDRSYLWSAFVGGMTAAAIALEDQSLCEQLLADLVPAGDTCAVNGALVCFMGAHAHRVGLLHAALGQPALAQAWLTKALQVHRRLGARAWEAETLLELARLGGEDAADRATQASALRSALHLDAAVTNLPAGTPLLLRVGDMWQATYRGQSAYLRDMKGLHDLAVLLAHPGVDVSSLELAGVRVSTGGADATLDRTALVAYRHRLAELDGELDEARSRSDLAAQERAVDEREQLLTYLRRAMRPEGRSRLLGATTAERARKAVTARIRDAIGRISEAFPELGTHLDRTVRTGTTCRYDPGPLGPARS